MFVYISIITNDSLQFDHGKYFEFKMNEKNESFYEKPCGETFNNCNNESSYNLSVVSI